MKNRAEVGAWVSITVYVILSLVKVIMGSMTQSHALTADGLNNVTDILASVGVLVGLRISRKPRDKDHPYGHSRAESISALVASFIMATIGVEVLWDGMRTAFTGNTIPPDLGAAWIALISAGIMFVVFLFNSRLAKASHSQAIYAISRDNLSDTLVSIGAAAGIIGSQFHLPWLDPVAAIIVGMIIIKTAWNIFREMTHQLTDGFQEYKLEQYKKTMEQIQGITRIVDLKGRMQGNDIILDVTIQVDAHLSVAESHQITEKLEQCMDRRHRVKTTHIHVEPDYEGT
ncbi:cation transporter [Kroppenstedtia pulmonis]|uniref:Cation transporter n=1 Tax=Kroppenstedtia pulmonis TaxID=1380685 RepID=A0A7D4B3J2_9BACL|nr:cation diffusion facilitator family transporter [Kroppenstedtia pulmonis]QKG85386.1 cation transporter [Kroppenstedtia pulmonis]